MKKTLSLILAVCIFMLTLCSCSESGFSLKINNAEIPEEIFNYYISVVENDDAHSDTEDKEAAALELCKKYAAGNELIEKYKVRLSAEEKVSVSEDTKNRWLYFEDFYKKYSVSKQTLNAIIEHEKLMEDVIMAIYSENGEKPLSEKEISAFYEKNYIAVQIISTDFSDENGNPLDKETINEITENFTVMRNIVRGGNTMESAAQQFPEFAEYDGEASIISSFDSSYPTGLFSKVSEIEKGDAQVFRYSGIIYLIHRLEPSEGSIYYSLYSGDCIIKMKQNEFENTLNTLAQSYEIVYNKA